MKKIRFFAMAALLMLSLAVNAAGTQTLTINGEKVEK